MADKKSTKSRALKAKATRRAARPEKAMAETPITSDNEELIARVRGAAGSLFAIMCIWKSPDHDDEDPQQTAFRHLAETLWNDASELQRRFYAEAGGAS
jgi:hypothetical protein